MEELENPKLRAKDLFNRGLELIADLPMLDDERRELARIIKNL